MPEYEQTLLQMGTIVQFRVISEACESDIQAALAAAQAAFRRVESVCSRFDPDSELRQLSLRPLEPVPVSDLLFEPLQFALAVAEETDGLFDPTVGRILHAQGFRHHYLTGAETPDDHAEPGDATYRDVHLDAQRRTVQLMRPLTLDLGAVAKGFAIDLAASQLRPFGNFLIDAGGDVYVGGHTSDNTPWQVGIRDPMDTDGILGTLSASDLAICTSGGYERKSLNTPGGHHLINPASGASPVRVTSSTVIAPYAMMADAFSTVIFLLGPEQGIQCLEQLGLDGMIVDDKRTIQMTTGMKEHFHE